MDETVSTEDVMKAEIYWALNIVKNHFSYKSCEDIVAVFKNMFPDSAIARKMSLGESKCRYITAFGLGPYFMDLMKRTIKKEEKYVLLFDESLNQQLQKKQLDIHGRFWSGFKVSFNNF